MGSEVTIIEMADSALTKEDDDVGSMVVGRLESEGLKFKTKHKVVRFMKKDSKQFVVCEHAGKEVEIECDATFALGRKARVSGYD